MNIPLHIPANVKTTQRLVVSQSQTQLDASKGDLKLSLRPPTKPQALQRSVLNVLTLGWYTRHQNRTQWRHVQQAALTTVDLRSPDAQSQLTHALATYADKRVTASRVSNFLADIEAIQNGQVLKEKSPKNLDEKQNFVARGYRTLKERHVRSMSAQAQQLRATTMQAPPKSDLRDNLLSILHPGYPIKNYACKAGQQALKSYAADKPVVFGSYFLNNELQRNLPKLVNSEEWKSFNTDLTAMANTGKRGLFVVPLELIFPKSKLDENHSVLLAIDPSSQKILYFDAKGHSLQDASQRYGNATGLHEAVPILGKLVFGESWQAETGILQMTLAKQQGANDCGAFTHSFTRRLIDGESLGDIERNFTAADRKQVRLQMAQDIVDYSASEVA